jgi:predicted kinase/SAM-dependent methyltransferase
MSDVSLRTTFNADIERYHAMRPHYPAALFEKLITDTKLPTRAELLEIGPGTGQATQPLAERGYHITAVELGDGLAAKAREALASYPNINVIIGAFEDVDLPTAQYNLIYSATAIHWIKPEVKFAKPHELLKPGGHLAIIHTEHVSDERGDEFFFASQPIYQKYHTKDKPINKQGDFTLPTLKDLRPPEKIDTALFAQESFTVFPMTITYSSQEYIDLLATYSPHLALAEDKRTSFLQEIKALIDKDFGGQMTKHYGMTLTIARKIELRGLVLLIGAPGAGKSTFAEQLIKQHGLDAAAYISNDAIAKELYAVTVDRGDKDGEIFAEQDRRIAERLANDRVAIVDATNVKPEARKRLITIAKQYGQPVTAFCFRRDLGTLLKQNQLREVKVPEAMVREYAELMKRVRHDVLLGEGIQNIFEVPAST